MKTKKIKELKTEKADSKNSIFKKTLTTAAVATAATLGSYNSAVAVNVTSGITDDDNTATAYDFNIANKTLTFIANVGNVYTIQAGAISDTTTQGNIVVVTHDNDTLATNLTIASIILDAGGTNGVFTITDSTGATGDLNVTVSGITLVENITTIKSLEAVNAETVNVTFTGTTTFDNAFIMDAIGSGVKGNVVVNVVGAATFSGGADIGGGTDAGDGSATLKITGVGAQIITGALDSEGADFTGDLTVTNTAGLVTFATAIGGNNDLKNTTIGASTFDSDVKFAAAVSSQKITVVGGNAADEDTTVQFVAAVVAPSMVMTSATAGAISKVSFIATDATTAFTGVITAGDTSGTGTEIHVIVSAAGAPTLQKITGAVGTTTNRIGLIAVGEDNGKAGALEFDAAVAATAMTITSNGGTNEDSVVNLDAAANITTITLDDDGVGLSVLALTTTAASVITGTIDGALVDEGTLQIKAANKTIAGNVGSTLDLLSVDVDASAIFNGDVSAKGINVAASTTATYTKNVTAGATLNVVVGTMALTGTTAQTISGVISGAATTGAITTSNAAGVTFADEVGGLIASSLEVQSITTSGTAKVIFTKDLNNVNEMKLASGTFLEISKTITNGQELFTASSEQDNASIDPAAIIIPSINQVVGNTLIFNDGMTTGHAAAMIVDLDSALRDTATLDYQTSLTATDEMTITAVAKTAKVAAGELATTVNEARALLQIQNAVVGTSADEDAVHNAMTAQGGLTATSDTALAVQAAPQSDMISGSTAVTQAVTGAVQGIVSNRMASLRSGDAYVTGMSAGDNLSANSGFLQAFGSNAEQGNVKDGAATIYGYDTETQGVAFGFDGMTENGSTLGLSASLSTTEVEGKGTGKANNDIDSYTVSVYADKATENGYIEGSLSYGVNDNSTHRVVNAAGLSARAYTADYNSTQVSLKLSAGSPNEVNDGTFVTPFGSVTGTIINTDTYTEKSTVASDNLRLKVDQDDVSSMVGTLGIKAHKVTDSGTPMISFAVNNEFGDTDISSTNTYQGGGTAFKTTSDIEALSATLGLGYSFGNDMTSLNIGYEGEMDDNEYVSHYGSLKIVSKF